MNKNKLKMKKWTYRETEHLIKELYKRPCLWDCCREDYKSRRMKDIAYNELRVKCQVDLKEIKVKLHNLRCHFLREYKRVQTSKTLGPKFHYVPKWHAYKLLLFLKNDDSYINPSFVKVEHNADENTWYPDTTLSSETNDVYTDSSSTQNHTEKKLSMINTEEREIPTTYIDSNDEHQQILSSEEYTVFGKFVSTELSLIQNPKTREIVKKKIQDALFEGKMDNFKTSEHPVQTYNYNGFRYCSTEISS